MAGFSDLQLQTARLLLRPLRHDDAAALYAIHADPAVMRYWSTPPWTGLDEAQRMIEGDIAAMATGRNIRLGLQRRDDGALVGHCTLFKLEPACRRAEVGYALARAAWGQGLMQEALTALLDHGFGALALNRVEADIDPRNAPSGRILERLGFVREGLMRERWIVAGETSDTAFYGLLRRDWMARRADSPTTAETS
jgi:[ribosomal protein S5]-alanine N-acetyltransferase